MPCCCCCKFKDDCDTLSDENQQQVAILCGKHGIQRDSQPFALTEVDRIERKKQRHSVYLNIYDLIDNKKNKKLDKLGMALYHSGVEIGRYEYSFGEPVDDTVTTGIFIVPPMTAMSTLCNRIYLGDTLISNDAFDMLIKRMKHEWPATRYELLHCNCNHFSRYLCKKLETIEPLTVPAWVNRISNAADCVVPRCTARWVLKKVDDRSAPPKSDSKEEKEKEKVRKEKKQAEAKKQLEAAKQKQSSASSRPTLSSASATLPVATSNGGKMPNFNTGREPPRKQQASTSGAGPLPSIREAKMDTLAGEQQQKGVKPAPVGPNDDDEGDLSSVDFSYADVEGGVATVSPHDVKIVPQDGRERTAEEETLPVDNTNLMLGNDLMPPPVPSDFGGSLTTDRTATAGISPATRILTGEGECQSPASLSVTTPKAFSGGALPPSGSETRNEADDKESDTRNSPEPQSQEGTFTPPVVPGLARTQERSGSQADTLMVLSTGTFNKLQQEHSEARPTSSPPPAVGEEPLAFRNLVSDLEVPSKDDHVENQQPVPPSLSSFKKATDKNKNDSDSDSSDDDEPGDDTLQKKAQGSGARLSLGDDRFLTATTKKKNPLKSASVTSASSTLLRVNEAGELVVTESATAASSVRGHVDPMLACALPELNVYPETRERIAEKEKEVGEDQNGDVGGEDDMQFSDAEEEVVDVTSMEKSPLHDDEVTPAFETQ